MRIYITIILLVLLPICYAKTEQVNYGLEITEVISSQVPSGYSAKCDNTSNGSPSLIVIFNTSKKTATISIFLGLEAKTIKIDSGEIAIYPETKGMDFEGKSLLISNLSVNNNAIVSVFLFSLGPCSPNIQKSTEKD